MYKFKFEKTDSGFKAYVQRHCHTLQVWSYFGDFATRAIARESFLNNPSF